MRYSYGTMFGLPIVAILLLSLAVVCWLAARKPVKWASAAAFALTAVVFVVSWWPFHWDYHRWSPVQGTVAAIDKRIIDTAEVYLISFGHTGQQYRCDDTRCAGARPGESLHLLCIREWQYASLHGYTCRYAGN